VLPDMPSASEFDPDRYREQVLEPARKLGGVLPADLLLRYAVPERVARDEEAFAAHVTGILKHWRALKQKRVYAGLAAGLLAAHSELAASGKVSYRHFAQRRADEKASAMQSLDRMAAAVAATTTIVDRSRVSSLGALLRGSLSDQTVEETLLKHRIAIVEQRWELPDPPPGPARSTLASNLAVLGLTLVAEATFGTESVRAGFRLRDGFRLRSGSRIDKEHLDIRLQQHAQRALGERKTALDNVLATLAGLVERPAALDALILWQLIDVLGPQITAGLPARSVADAAADLGLDRGEAAELAFTLMERRTFQDPTRASVQDALNAGELFIARRRAVALPDGDELRQRIEIEAGRVDALIKEANEARRQGEVETEAELISRALALAGNAAGDLRARLQSLPPPAPIDVRATIKDDQVHLSWAPAPARTGGLHYRVLRGLGSPVKVATGGHLVDDTAELRALDVEPPPGDALHYCVLASRGGDVWSAPAAAGEPLVVLPEVVEPELDARDGGVLGSWQTPPGATDVLVSRRPGSAPDPVSPGRRVTATLAGFHDPQVAAGIRHFYRIHAVYVDQDGRRRISPGVVRAVTRETPMEAVTDLRVEKRSSPRRELRITWTAPTHGSVQIYRHHGPPPWPVGTAVDLPELSRHGRPITGATERADSRPDSREFRITLPEQDGRSYFTAMTVGIDQALVGPTVAVASVSPITRLQADRYQDRVRLRWAWPDNVHVSRIEWRPTDSGRAGGSADCGRRRYHDDGGVEITVGPGPVVVSVLAVRRDAEGETASVPVNVTVPGQNVLVKYSFRRRTRWTPWVRSALVLTADRAVHVPPLIVVRTFGRVMPLRPETGSPVLRVPELDLRAGEPRTIALPATADGDTGWLGCFLAPPTHTRAGTDHELKDPGIVLIQADEED
jgi:hypothetical protein